MANAKSDSASPTARADSAPPMPVPVPGAPAARAGLGAWLPVLAALILAPAATWATVEFFMLPRLQKKIAAGPAAHAGAEAAPAAKKGGPAAKGAKEGKGGDESGPGTYEFQNVVVNLAGTMGTRYLKTTFLVTGAKEADIRVAFDGARPRLMDVTLNVLSSLTLADLEEPGAKNIIREKLVGAYNQALGKKVADQVYFSDFVIQ